MPVTVKLRYLRIAPRKVRLVADALRKKTVEEAQGILNFTNKRAALPLAKLLKSGIAAAREILDQTSENLYISKIFVDQGPTLKRWRARARGRAAQIQKKTSHITLTLDIIKETPKKVAAKAKTVPAKPLKKTAEPAKPAKSEEKKPEKSALRPFRPEKEIRKTKPKGLKRFFRRKAF